MTDSRKKKKHPDISRRRRRTRFSTLDYRRVCGWPKGGVEGIPGVTAQ